MLGGARSGKSAKAEAIVTALELPRVYIATAQAFDTEMRSRIEDHKTMRGDGWQTVEAPLDLAAAIDDLPRGSACLVDCMTLWLSNVMLAEKDVAHELDVVFAAIQAHPAPLVLVSNELGLGIVPENKLARQFRDAHGRMNQKLATLAERVVFVAAGLPLMLKGRLPKGAE